MQLGRYRVSTLRPPPIHSISFSESGKTFLLATDKGFEAWSTNPLKMLRRQDLDGSLALAVPLENNVLVMVGGAKNPLYPPNKAIIWDDLTSEPYFEIEFRERILGVTIRRDIICIVMQRRVALYRWWLENEEGERHWGKGEDFMGKVQIERIGEWETAVNDSALIAISVTTGSTVLALPGRQVGHVQLIPLSPSPPSMYPGADTGDSPGPSSFRSPIILAAEHPLSSLACTRNGSHIITSSERGTLLRVWDTAKGNLVRELRRGVDPVQMWGANFECGLAGGNLGGMVVGWSDKGTVHVWDDGAAGPDGQPASSSPQPSITNILSRNIPLPKYFSSTASFAQYHLPRKNPHAFASAMSAAADKTGISSQKLSSDAEEPEKSEHFIVSWIEVEVDDTSPDDPAPAELPAAKSMGSREERRSFGAETNTSSRTATPTFSRQQSTFATGSSGFGTPHIKPGKGAFGSARKASISEKTAKMAKEQEPAKKKKIEKQLVAITYSGDWYRLRIPTQRDIDDEKNPRRKGKCELVEYRRIKVGGGGW